MKLELKKIKLGPGSEETTQFTAELYINGELVALCDNSGKGGETDIRAYPKHETREGYDKVRKIIAEAEAYAKTLPGVPSSFSDDKLLPMSLDFWVDLEVDKFAQVKDREKIIKRIDKACETKVLIFNKKEFESFMAGKTLEMSQREWSFKKPLSSFPVDYLKEQINGIKNRISSEEFIYNKNLPKGVL